MCDRGPRKPARQYLANVVEVNVSHLLAGKRVVQRAFRNAAEAAVKVLAAHMREKEWERRVD